MSAIADTIEKFIVLHPIFDMNVPEGFLADQIKRRMAKHMQVDEMRLLSAIGGNQIG